MNAITDSSFSHLRRPYCGSGAGVLPRPVVEAQFANAMVTDLKNSELIPWIVRTPLRLQRPGRVSLLHHSELIP